ncbi:nucleoporin Nup37 [Atheta coriaria]|uniref:nucleoporin Nup37 n=1 Tax=Dalotia coriaria TaxID=877792 RepID=UPI0031F35817
MNLNRSVQHTNQTNDQQVNFIDLQETSSIKSVHFSPYEWSQDTIIVVLEDLIIVGQVSIQDTISLKKLCEIEYSGAYTALSISPDACISTLPIHIQFCVADTKDFNLRVYSCTGTSEEAQVHKDLVGHRSYINAVAYDPENNYISSVSDDNTCRVWSIPEDHECVATFILSSPGMATCWHREDVSKLLVAEKCGIIRFYNINTQKALMSLDVRKNLYDVHWAPSDSQLLGSLQMGELILWDVTKPSCPKQKLLFTQHGGSLRFSALGELVAAVNKLEGSLKVVHIHTLQQRLNVPIQLPTNVTWHSRLPVLCVGDDRRLCFWKVKSK